MYIMKIGNIYNSLCTPAQLYLVLSVISILALLMQNCSSPMTYTVGRYTVPLEHHNMIFFVFKAIYILVWTFLLNQLCRYGYGGISWFLVLLPFILMFVIIALLLLANMR